MTATSGTFSVAAMFMRFVEGAGVGGAVAEEGQDDLAAVLELLGQGRADGRGLVAADDAGRAEVVLCSTSAMCIEPPRPLQ